MKRILAIAAATALLALALAGCGDVTGRTDGTAAPDGTAASETARDGGAYAGNGTAGSYAGNAASGGYAGNGSGLGGVTGAINGADGSYTSRNNGGWVSGAAEADARASELRYAQMLENGRVHDTDGFLFDGENSSFSTF